jgi:outer membrane lipopolysaccharide assembly protein LptE/RlpB
MNKKEVTSLMKMSKKSLMVAATLALILCLTACTSTIGNTAGDSTAGDKIATELTPPGAVVTSGVTTDDLKTLTIESSKPLSELITFYKAALDKLGAQEIVSSETSTKWTYAGT